MARLLSPAVLFGTSPILENPFQMALPARGTPYPADRVRILFFIDVHPDPSPENRLTGGDVLPMFIRNL
jgi:hypothetical protein